MIEDATRPHLGEAGMRWAAAGRGMRRGLDYGPHIGALAIRLDGALAFRMAVEDIGESGPDRNVQAGGRAVAIVRARCSGTRLA